MNILCITLYTTEDVKNKSSNITKMEISTPNKNATRMSEWLNDANINYVPRIT